MSDLVNHLFLGNRMTAQMLAGTDVDAVIARLDDDLLGASSDPLADFAALADQVHEGFSADGALEGTVSHPMGEIPRSMFIGFRIGDYMTHAWDLARAIGADESLDAELVSHVWDDIQPRVEMLGESGMFGEGSSGDVADDAPLQERYLDLVGRRS